MSGLFAPNLLSHFRFDRTWSETETLQTFLESFCVHSLSHAFFSFPKEALLACTSSFSRNLPSFTAESTLFFPCSCSDPLLSRQGAALAHLDLSHFKIWCSGLTSLFLFLLARAVLAYLLTTLSVALRPLFPYQRV